MDKGGTVEIFLDLDGVSGYQAGGQDIVLVQNIKPGGDTIIWDSKDGNGDFVEGEVIVGITSRFSTGVTHLPLYDPEYHPNGYIVHSILPDSARAKLYWDDSQIGGTTEFEGVMADTNGHNFPEQSGGFGNERTINTWWNGYEDNNLKSFSFSLLGDPLPIELAEWNVEYKGEYVQLSWTTASETNNNQFIVERSQNGIDWEKYISIPGAGNSTSILHYHEIDETPYTGISYYRLKQIDYNGIYTFSEVKSIQTNFEHSQNIRVFCYVKNNIVTITGNNLSVTDIYIRTATGKDVKHHTPVSQIDSRTFEIDFSNLAAGSYIIQTPYSQKIISKK
ncbi:MAG: T9SS type A sorting domain-containing protein [Bacteroidota bacterium]